MVQVQCETITCELSVAALKSCMRKIDDEPKRQLNVNFPSDPVAEKFEYSLPLYEDSTMYDTEPMSDDEEAVPCLNKPYLLKRIYEEEHFRIEENSTSEKLGSKTSPSQKSDVVMVLDDLVDKIVGLHSMMFGLEEVREMSDGTPTTPETIETNEIFETQPFNFKTDEELKPSAVPVQSMVVKERSTGMDVGSERDLMSVEREYSDVRSYAEQTSIMVDSRAGGDVAVDASIIQTSDSITGAQSRQIRSSNDGEMKTVDRNGKTQTDGCANLTLMKNSPNSDDILPAVVAEHPIMACSGGGNRCCVVDQTADRIGDGVGAPSCELITQPYSDNPSGEVAGYIIDTDVKRDGQASDAEADVFVMDQDEKLEVNICATTAHNDLIAVPGDVLMESEDVNGSEEIFSSQDQQWIENENDVVTTGDEVHRSMDSENRPPAEKETQVDPLVEIQDEVDLVGNKNGVDPPVGIQNEVDPPVGKKNEADFVGNQNEIDPSVGNQNEADVAENQNEADVAGNQNEAEFVGDQNKVVHVVENQNDIHLSVEDHKCHSTDDEKDIHSVENESEGHHLVLIKNDVSNSVEHELNSLQSIDNQNAIHPTMEYEDEARYLPENEDETRHPINNANEIHHSIGNETMSLSVEEVEDGLRSRVGSIESAARVDEVSTSSDEVYNIDRRADKGGNTMGNSSLPPNENLNKTSTAAKRFADDDNKFSNQGWPTAPIDESVPAKVGHVEYESGGFEPFSANLIPADDSRMELNWERTPMGQSPPTRTRICESGFVERGVAAGDHARHAGHVVTAEEQVVPVGATESMEAPSDTTTSTTTTASSPAPDRNVNALTRAGGERPVHGGADFHIRHGATSIALDAAAKAVGNHQNAVADFQGAIARAKAAVVVDGHFFKNEESDDADGHSSMNEETHDCEKSDTIWKNNHMNDNDSIIDPLGISVVTDRQEDVPSPDELTKNAPYPGFIPASQASSISYSPKLDENIDSGDDFCPREDERSQCGDVEKSMSLGAITGDESASHSGTMGHGIEDVHRVPSGDTSRIMDIGETFYSHPVAGNETFYEAFLSHAGIKFIKMSIRKKVH